MLALKELLHNLKDRDWDVNPVYKIDENEARRIIEGIEAVNSDVLDKIRAEIEQITDTMGVRYNQYVSKIDVLHIIDKYKAESEG